MSADNDIKKIMETFADQFVARFLPGAEFLNTLTIELPRDALRADFIIRVRYQGRIIILLIEWQSYYDALMSYRLGQYLLSIWYREREAIQPIVIYLNEGSTAASPWNIDGLIDPPLTVRHQAIKLWEEPVEVWLASQAPGLMPFVPMLQGATIESLTPAITCLDQTVESVALRSTLINFLVTFASRAFGAEQVEDYFRRHPVLDVMITESPWYQEILRRGNEQGLEQGLERGLEQGLERGKVSGLQKALRRLVERRFLPIAEQAEALFGAIHDEAQLTDLIGTLSTLETPEAALEAIQSVVSQSEGD